jgi:hypothetical protein
MCVLLLTTCGTLVGRAQESPPLVIGVVQQELQVVQTADALAAAPGIPLAQGVAHVGIEADRTEARGTLMVYCRMDSVDEGPARYCGEPLGPLSLVVVQEDHRRLVDLRKEAALAQSAHAVLYEKNLHFADPGAYIVEVCMPDGTVVAQKKVRVAAAKEPWGWRTVEPAPVMQVVGVPQQFRVSPVAAIPRGDGAIGRPMPMENLPTAAIPTHPSKAFEVSFADGVVTVNHWPVEFFAPQRQLLARFYVNGKIAAPGKDLTRQAMLHQDQPITGPAHLGLEINRAMLGANPGDKVEMELLFCREWVDRVYAPATEAHMLPSPNGDGDGWLLSNRVVLPDDTNGRSDAGATSGRP